MHSTAQLSNINIKKKNLNDFLVLYKKYRNIFTKIIYCTETFKKQMIFIAK